MAENHRFFTQCRKGRKERVLNKELVSSIGEISGLKHLGDSNILLPPLAFEGLFLVYHSFGHFLSEGLSLRHICDWAFWMKANQDKIDWESFYSKCCNYGYGKFLDVITAISVNRLGLIITNPKVKIIDTFVKKVLDNTIYEDSKIYSRGGK